MNLSKKFKKDISNDDDDDVIILESSIPNEFCQHIDQITGESCREYYSVICIHCNLSLCYIHVEIHRVLLINQRDQLINELNERIDQLNQFLENPDKIQKFLIETFETKYQKKISFIQRIGIEKLINLNEIINELKNLFQPIHRIFKDNQSVSLIQIKKIQQSFIQFDENKKLLFNNIIDSIPIQSNQSINLFHLSNIEFPCRQYELPIQRSNYNEMAASEDLLMINDREHILLFNLTNSLEENLIPELIQWKSNLDGKIFDIHYSFYLKLFFILTDEKLFLFDRLSSPPFISLHRFTSQPWSCTTVFNSIYILYKYSTSIEQWTFEQTLTTSIQMKKQWKLKEILRECEHDQHLRCIRSNSSQTQLAILIADDECRWRIALFDNNMICLHQTDILPNASTIDWNLMFSFISDQQLLIMDATTDNIYLITFTQNTSSIEYKQYSDSDYPVNSCVITHNGYSQLILKMVKPNMLKFFQI